MATSSTTRKRISNLYCTAGLLALQGIALIAIAVLTFPAVGTWHALDLSVYANASLRIMQGQVPYRDFGLEYPPVALVAFTLPRIIAGDTTANLDEYRRLFLVEGVVWSTLIALVIARICAHSMLAREQLWALAVYSLLVAILAPLAPWRYDLFPALLTVLALMCVLRERAGLAGIWLGLGIAAKLYPIVLVPVFGVYYLFNRQYRALVFLAAGSSVTLLLTAGICAWFAPGTWLSFLQYHEQRGLQIESVVGGLVCLAGMLKWADATMAFNYGALHFANPAITALVNWLQLVFGALFVGLLGVFAYRLRNPRVITRQEQHTLLIHTVVAALLIFIVTNKVFSPQYMIWLLPFIPLLSYRKIAVFTLICSITIIIFPFSYAHLLALEPAEVVLLNVRNALAIVAIPLLFYVSPAERQRGMSRVAEVHTGAQGR